LSSIRTPKQIEKETGRRFVDICTELINEGLSPTEIAHKLKLRGSDEVQKCFYKERLADKSNIQYPELVDQSTKDLIALCPSVVGMEYKDFIYQKYIVEGLSAAEIASIIGQNAKKIERHIKSFGFTKTLSQARQDSIRKGVINYQEIIAKSRKTRRKSTSFSNTQDMVRNMFKDFLESHGNMIQTEGLEIILGYDELGILGDKEVDIPIVIFKTVDQTAYKFSIELNGRYVHSSEKAMERDRIKAIDLEAKGWKHFVIEYTDSNRQLEQRVRTIIKEIFSVVFNRQLRKQ
jgi:hypothetical protein